jgi:hypothetical protein
MIKKADRNNDAERELRKLESQWHEALTQRDVTKLDRLMADDYVLSSVSGEVVDKGRVLQDVKSGELTHSYSVESNNEVKMTKQEIIEMIERAGFEAVERDTVYNRVEQVAA